MITASIVLYKNDLNEVNQVLNSAINSIIDRIFIIDNSPTDDLKIVNRLSIKIIYVFSNANLGYGSGHNIAIRKSFEQNADYHIVLNPDIIFDNSAIKDIMHYMEENRKVGQLLPKVTYPNGKIQYVCKLIPTPFDLIFKRFLPSSFTKKRMDKFQLKFTGYKNIMNVPYLSGCFMFFRISALKQVGLFDERFFMYPEDIDITRRIHKYYDTIFYPHVTIIHAHAAESYKSKKMLWIHISNMIKYFNKWGWIFDKDRKDTNKKVLKKLEYKKYIT